MSLPIVQHPEDLPGAVEPVQRRDASTNAIGLQHPMPLPHHHFNPQLHPHLPQHHYTPPPTGPHQPQHWAQHVNNLHPPTGRPLALPLPLLRPEPLHNPALSALHSPSVTRPSPFLLSLHVGDEVDCLDEIGYRQWRHAFILELGHIPGQTVQDSGRVGEYKVRWAGWDSKWDEFVHGNRLAPLNSKVIGDTGPEAISEKESAHRIGKEWRKARQQGILTDVAITFQPDSTTQSASSHHRSLSCDDSLTAPLMLAHLALLSVRCPSLLSMFTDSATDSDLLSYQLHPHSDSQIASIQSTSPAAAAITSLDGEEQATAIPPPTSARLHSDLHEGGWRRGRLSTPAGMRGGVVEVVSMDSPRSARPSSLGGRPATADASTTRAGMRSQQLGSTLHYPSSSSGSAASMTSAPRRALNFSDTSVPGSRRSNPSTTSVDSSASRAPINRSRTHLAPNAPSLSASAPSSPLTQQNEAKPSQPPPLINAQRHKPERWSASGVDDDEVQHEVESTLEAMTAAVELVDSIKGQTLEYADSDDDGQVTENKEKEEKNEGFMPLTDDDDLGGVATSATPSTGQLIPVFCVPGLRSYAALRAFVEFVYTDAFDSSVQANGGKQKRKKKDAESAEIAGGEQPEAERVRVARPERRHMREVAVGAEEGEDSDEERLGLMDPDLQGIEDELISQAIAARYGREFNLAASRALAQIDAGLRREMEQAIGADEDDDEEVEANPAHVLSMSDLFDLACIGSRFHFPRLIALCASQLSSMLNVENIMEALQLCVRVGCLGGDQEDLLNNIFASTSSSLLPPSSIAPPSSSSLPSHRAHDLSILLRIAFDHLSHHWDIVMKQDSSVRTLHTLPFSAFSAVVQVKGRSVNSSHGAGRYTPPVVHHPASRLVRDIKQLYLQRGPPPSSSSSSATPSTNPATGSSALLVASTHSPCDFQIRVGDTVHWCHRSVLACRSEYFRALFSSRMQESNVSSITFPLSQHSPDSIATLLRYVYYDDLSNISYEAALYLLHHCTDFFGLVSNQLEAACEQLIMQECEGAAGGAGQGSRGGEGERDGERRVGLSDVVRMSWRMSKWPLFERAVKFLDWKGLDALITQAYATASSPAASPPVGTTSPYSSLSPTPHSSSYASRLHSTALPAQPEEKTNSDSLHLLSSASTSSTACPSPPLPAAFDMDLVRAIVAEKASPGVTMRERGGVVVGREDDGLMGESGLSSRQDSRRDSLRIDGIGLMRRAMAMRGEDDEVEEELGAGIVHDVDDDDDGLLDDEDDVDDDDVDLEGHPI